MYILYDLLCLEAKVSQSKSLETWVSSFIFLDSSLGGRGVGGGHHFELWPLDESRDTGRPWEAQSSALVLSRIMGSAPHF